MRAVATPFGIGVGPDMHARARPVLAAASLASLRSRPRHALAKATENASGDLSAPPASGGEVLYVNYPVVRADRPRASPGSGCLDKGSDVSTSAHPAGDRRSRLPRKVAHPRIAERMQLGRAARVVTPRTRQGDFSPAHDRPDPIALLERQAKSRVPELVPIRYGRMLASPFAFYRGAALVMANDLATTPASGLRVQLCGDAHLSNFGIFATPERRMIFDINDFDETSPGRGSGTSSAWRRASRWRRARMATPWPIAPRSSRRVHAATGPPWLSLLPRPTSRSSTRSLDIETAVAEFQGLAHPQDAQARGHDHRQGPHPRQHAGVQQTHPDGRWPAAASSVDPPLIVPVTELVSG